MTLSHIQEINRYEYLQSDLDPTASIIWSEPGDDEGKNFFLIKKSIFVDWGISNRGLGYYFPKKATKMFLHVNGFKMMFIPFRIEKQVKRVQFLSLKNYRLKGYSYTHDKMILKFGSAPSFLWNELGALVEVDEYGERKM